MKPEKITSNQTHQDTGLLTSILAPVVIRSAIIIAGLGLLVLAWTRNVNWDEFYFLSLIHAFQDGRLDRPLQTFFVHGFGWLSRVPGHETEQIFAARIVMTALFASSVYSIHRISCALADREAANIAVIAFLTSGFVLAHGTSFRADPIAAAFLIGALAIMMTGRMWIWQTAAVTFLSAGALLITIKAALYLPAYLGVLAWRWGDRRVVLRILMAWVAGLFVAAGSYYWHAAGIVSAPNNGTTANAHNALTTTLLKAGLFPRSEETKLWALLSFGGVMLALFGFTAPGTTRAKLVRVAFVLPLLLSVIFYRNAFPYFFAYITPPMIAVVAVGAAKLGKGPLLGGLTALMLISGAGQMYKALTEDAVLQRATLKEVHRLFPEPVHYIDHNGMVASFPRVGFFMSSWGIARYRAVKQPVMADWINRMAPPFLLTNRSALHLAMTLPTGLDHPGLLLLDDQKALRETYVHYSGVIWLAGRDVTLSDTSESVTLAIPGRYLLESEVPVTIDGQIYSDGMTLDLDAPILINGTSGQSLRFIWDTPGAQKENALPFGEIYAKFWRLHF